MGCLALIETSLERETCVISNSCVSFSGEWSRRGAASQWEGAHARHTRLPGGWGSGSDAAKVPQKGHREIQTILWSESSVQPHTGGRESPIISIWRHVKTEYVFCSSSFIIYVSQSYKRSTVNMLLTWNKNTVIFSVLYRFSWGH